ncbi:MAG: Cell division protein FtsH [Labilithrix sp.]|nr:Cell division protein FtsH [Labilithrix sp.]
MTTGGPAKKPFPLVAVIVPAAVIGVMVTLLAIWQFLTPAERHVVVPYSDFIAEVHAGRVDEIQVRNRDIRYRVRSSDRPGAMKETVGPVPNQAFLDSLKPTDPSAPLPKVIFEK